MTKEIELTRGYKAIVDDEDFEYLSQFKWHATREGYAWTYQLRNKQRVHIGMHQEVLERKLGQSLPANQTPDHIDLNPTNNTRQNLRPSTHAQNMRNKAKRKTATTSRFKGVGQQKSTGKWLARIIVGGVYLYLGTFDDEELAAKAYDTMALLWFGEFANLNFPDADYAPESR